MVIWFSGIPNFLCDVFHVVFSRVRTCFCRAHTREQIEVVCTNSPPFRMLLNLNCLHEFLRRAKKKAQTKNVASGYKRIER